MKTAKPKALPPIKVAVEPMKPYPKETANNYNTRVQRKNAARRAAGKSG